MLNCIKSRIGRKSPESLWRRPQVCKDSPHVVRHPGKVQEPQRTIIVLLNLEDYAIKIFAKMPK